ncbi:MAG: hypothetical protein P8L72_04660 [Flavobacteriaceae bacterium]|jgi:hypothetical protein|nr:hypothetical protein [Flavobacteriaceae bacterium]MDG2314653.1 hypothetical protein [Flavobacteriaceae bacterium]
MKWQFFCVGMFACFVSGQHRVEKTFSSAGIGNVEIVGNEVFSIEIGNSDSQEIKLISRSEGEYADAIKLHTDITQNTLKIQAAVRDGFRVPNDKLSAHKVFATQLTLFLPANLRVRVESHLSNVKIKGTFPFLSALLYEGNCYFEKFKGKATITSNKGSIYGKTQAATLQAVSKKGTVLLPKKLPIGNPLILKTIHGNIEIHQTKF